MTRHPVVLALTGASGSPYGVRLLDVLANERRLDGPTAAGASDDVMEALYTWYQDGWLELA